MGIGIGIIGAGRMGRTHIRLIGEAIVGAWVVGVCDLVAEMAESAAREARTDVVFRNPRELVGCGRVDAVIVASGMESHEDIVLACIAARKPVLCEKPLAATGEGAARIVEAENRAGRRLVQVGFMRRFDPGYIEMKRRVAAGEVGEALVMHCVHRHTGVPREFDSERMVRDGMAHEIDIARWLFEEEIVRVRTYRGRSTGRVRQGVSDPQLAILETEGGRLVDIELFLNSYGYDVRCEVVGEEGAVSLGAHAGVALETGGRRVAEMPAGFEERFEGAYVAEVRAWVSGLERGCVVGPGAGDGHAAAVVCDAVAESLRTGGCVEVGRS